jgi:hypothetical protein
MPDTKVMIVSYCSTCLAEVHLSAQKCPDCGAGKRGFSSASEADYDNMVRLASSPNVDSKVNQATLEDLLAAQERTTHAVRSLAISFVAAPIISFFVLVGFFLATRSGNTAVVVVVGVISIAVLIGTFFVAINELSLSKVEK